MSDNYGAIQSGLEAGKRAAEALMSWQTGAQAYDDAKAMRDACESGLLSLSILMLASTIGNQKLDWDEAPAPTSCECRTSPPPCGYCTRDIDQ